MAPAQAPRFERIGEDCLLLRFDARIDAAGNARVHALASRLRSTRPDWVVDIVPAFASVAVFIDLDGRCEGDPLHAAEAWMETQASHPEPHIAPGRTIEIPVRYGGAGGADLDEVAAHAGMQADEVIARHSAPEYSVAMLGFAPGFPYLLGLDPAIAIPRRATPRLRVPAGSVGIGGVQSGIYPRTGPGGWRLIGRTEATLFDPLRDPPALLAPGDRVRFVPVTS
ncbi:MAG: 5-oxoprolinase subunit PxpB [Luteimonas sp.]